MCTNLQSIPLFNTSNVVQINSMFYKCVKVQSGALALYNQMISQTNPPTNHNMTFTDCGSDTTTGRSDLRKIPYAWGGNLT